MAVDLLEVPADDDHHILSIQSHVIRGYVGNRACGLGLQLLGHEVDIINTVDFASMYVHEGRVLNREDFIKMHQGVFKALGTCEGSQVRSQNSDSLVSSHDFPILMTGYTGDPQVLSEICQLAEKLKEMSCTSSLIGNIQNLIPFLNGNCLWLLDPVMGDNNALYVSQSVEVTYREIFRKADIITPNEYELKWLLDNKYSLDSSKDILNGIAECHKDGPSVVILTSCQMKDKFFSLCSVKSNKQDPTESTMIVSCFQKQEIYVGGCGDCFAALLVDRLKHTAKLGKMNAVGEAWKGIMHDVQSTLQRILTIAKRRSWASINVIKCMNLLYGRNSSSKFPQESNDPLVGTKSFVWNLNNVESASLNLDSIFSS